MTRCNSENHVPFVAVSEEPFEVVGRPIAKSRCLHGRLLLFAKLADRISFYERRFGTPFDGPLYQLALKIISIQFPRKTNLSSSIWYTRASRKNRRIRSEFWRRLDRRLDHHGLARHQEQRHVRSSLTHNVKPYATRESRASKVRKYPLLWASCQKVELQRSMSGK